MRLLQFSHCYCIPVEIFLLFWCDAKNQLRRVWNSKTQCPWPSALAGNPLTGKKRPQLLCISSSCCALLLLDGDGLNLPHWIKPEMKFKGQQWGGGSIGSSVAGFTLQSLWLLLPCRTSLRSNFTQARGYCCAGVIQSWNNELPRCAPATTVTTYCKKVLRFDEKQVSCWWKV